MVEISAKTSPKDERRTSANIFPKSCRVAVFVITLLFSHPLFADLGPYFTLTSPTVADGQVQFSLEGNSGTVCVIESSPDMIDWTPVATNNDPGSSRAVTLLAPAPASFYRARIPLAPILAYAVAASGNINFNGSGIVSDSFNSADPNFSTNGQYDSSKARTNGNVASGGGIIDLGNHVMNGSVYLGSTAGVTFTAGSQLQGSIYPNQNFWFRDVILPSGIWLAAPVVNSTNLLTASGNYLITNPGPIDVAAGTTVFLKITATNFTSTIQIHGGTMNSGTAYLYLTGNSAILSGNLASDASGAARNLWVFGLPSLTSLSLSSVISTNFTGVIYAPSANASITSGKIKSLVGSFITSSLTLNGSFTFHFDEDLLNTGHFP
jgi:hypothetical protein